MTALTPVEDAWRRHRPYLVNLAYQVVGDIGYAEDAVQEAFLRLSRSDVTAISEVRGWLTVVVGRLCLDHLRSAGSRREQVITTTVDVAAADADPADRVTLDDQVADALLRVLGSLTPAERVAFVLHDVFGMPFGDIARATGRPAGTCRQLARRARLKFASGKPISVGVRPDEHRALTERFITACANGDLTALTAVLDPSVWGAGHLIGDPPPPPQINYGPHDVATNLLRYLGPGATVVSGPLGHPVLLAFAHRQLFAVVTLTLGNGRVTKIEATADPAARAAAEPPRP